jgi:peptide/nickel transport system substrate-binding protein
VAPLSSSENGYNSFEKLPNSAKFESDWPKNNSVLVHILAEPDNLHPTNGTSQTRAELFLYLHAGLLRTDLRSGTIAPGICSAMPIVSDDQKSLTFTLRNDVFWDDGSPVTAADVTFTVKASKLKLTNNPSNKFYFENVKEVIEDPKDNKRFTIVMKQVFVQNVAMWCDYPIIHAKFYDPSMVTSSMSFDMLNDTSAHPELSKRIANWADAFNNVGNGSNWNDVDGLGPYKLVAAEAGTSWVLERKKNHWSDRSSAYNEKSYPDKIIFKVNQEPVSQKIEFLSQKIDGSGYLGTRLLMELKQDSSFNRNYHSKFMDTYGYTYIAMNMRPDGVKHASILSDLNVRKALASAARIDDMIKVVNKGINKRVAGPVSPLKKESNPALKIIPYNVKVASDLLDKSGWRDSDNDGIRDKIINGKKTDLIIELAYLSVIPEWKEMATIIAEGMKPAGIKIVANGYDYPMWLQKVTSHDYEMAMGAWNTTSLPEDYSQLWSTDSYVNQGSNYTGFGSATTDRLINAIATTMDNDERMKLEYQMQQAIYDEQPYIFLYGLVRRCVMHKRFADVEFYAERPGLLYNHVKLLSPTATNAVNP